MRAFEIRIAFCSSQTNNAGERWNTLAWKWKLYYHCCPHIIFIYFLFFYSVWLFARGETITLTHVHCLWGPDKHKCPNVSVVGDCWLSVLITSQKVGDQTPRQQDTKVNQRECEDLRLCSSWKQKLLQRSSDGPRKRARAAARDSVLFGGKRLGERIHKYENDTKCKVGELWFHKPLCEMKTNVQTILHKCTDGICTRAWKGLQYFSLYPD